MSFDVSVEIRAKVDRAVAEVARLDDRISELGDTSRRSFSSATQQSDQLAASVSKLEGFLANASRAFAGAAIIQQLLQTADAVTTLNNRLALATGSVQAQQKAYQELFSVAQQNRQSFVQLGGVYASMALSGTANMRVVEGISAAMTISGGASASLNAALVQLQQAMASGVLRGEELNSVMEQMPRLAKAIADGMGVTIGQLRALGEAGVLTSQQVSKAIESQLETLRREVQSSAITVAQGWTALSNSATNIVGVLDRVTGASSAVARFMRGLGAAIDFVATRIKENETPLRLLANVFSLNMRGVIDVLVENTDAGRAYEQRRLQNFERASSLPGWAGRRARQQASELQTRMNQRALGEWDDTAEARPSPEQQAKDRAYAELVADLEGRTTKYAKAVEVLAERLKEGRIGQEEYARLVELARQSTERKSASTKSLSDAMLKRNQLIQAGTENMDRWDFVVRQSAASEKALADAAARTALRRTQIYEDAEELADRRNKSAQELVASIERESAAMQMSNRERELSNALLELERRGIQRGTAEWEDYSDQIKRAVSIRADLRDQQELSRRQADVARQMADQVASAARQMESDITNGLMRAFERGGSFSESFARGLQSIGQTFAVRPFVGTAMNSVRSAMGLPTQPVAGAGALLSLGQTLSMSGLGRALGLSDSFSAGGQSFQFLSRSGNLLSSSLQSLGNGFTGYTLSRALSGNYSAGSWVNTAAALASMIPGVGPIAGAVGGLVNRAFGMAPRTTNATGFSGTFSAGGFSGNNFEDWSQRGGWFRSSRRGTNLSDLSPDAAATFGAGANAAFQSAQEYARVLSLPIDGLTSITSQARIVLTQDQAANQRAVEQAVQDYSNALASSFSASLQPFQRAGEEIAGTLQRLAGLQVFSRTINELGSVFSRVASLGVDARESMIALAGGVDAFTQNAMGFVQNYYSRDEIAGLKARELQGVLSALGITQDFIGADSASQFRRLVEGTDVGTDAGRNQIASLLRIQGDFAQVAQYLAETGMTLSGAAAQAPAVAQLENIFTQSANQQVAAIQQGSQSIVEAIEGLHQTIRESSQQSTQSSTWSWMPNEVVVLEGAG